jgi:hypothetical protein
MIKRIFFTIIIIMAFINGSYYLSGAQDFYMSNSGLRYQWDPNNLPEGRNPPYLGVFDGHYALKTNKYLEAYVDLGQGPDGTLRLTGPMTLTAVFQLAKQWPMKAALISKWGFIQGQAAYELGLTPDRKIYFQLSTSGKADNYFELVSNKIIKKEVPVVVTAVFEPGKEVAIYIDGEKVGAVTKDVPSKCYDGSASVKLLPRFEGIFAGAWFYNRALSKTEIKDVSKQLEGMLPSNVPYDKWKANEKRNIIIGKAEDYLGTTAGVKLYKEIDISKYKGSYVCPGDLDNDGRIDFLLYKNGNTYNVPGRLIAVDFDGKTLWEKGDKTLMEHERCGSAPAYEKGTSPALRGIAAVFDIDQDGRSEVISELWENNKPMLYILDGATGAVKCRVESPINMSVRQPRVIGNRQSSRTHPLLRIAYLNGRDKAPSIIIKYEASNGLPCHAFALDNKLNVLWHVKGTSHSMGHIPTVADVDNDGKDEIVLGHMLVDNNGKVLWDKGAEFTWHADCTAVAQLREGDEKQILISTCGVGPLYCLDYKGNILWQKTREEISHGQAVWVGNFIENIKGPQIIALTAGHTGQFVTLRGCDGATIANFNHRKILDSYPDYPQVVNWKNMKVQSLWIPQDRILVDGYGNVVAELGNYDKYVQDKLHCGTSWRPVGAQVFALDVLGDDRDELIMYEPYAGESIFIFCNPDSDQKLKPYIPQPAAYNIRSYF